MSRAKARATRSLVRTIAALCAGLCLAMVATPARATNVRDIARIDGHGESVLRGLGLVMGLNGTGDSGQELLMARPLMNVLQNSGNPVGDISELASNRSVALVMVTVTVPRGGALADDKLDMHVQVIHSARSLAGGRLFLTPLLGPSPDDPNIYAIGEGEIVLENPQFPTSGLVRGGARMRLDVLPPDVGDSFVLVLEPPYAGHKSTSTIASSINNDYFNNPHAEGAIARALDDRRVLIEVPPVERASPAEFVGAVLSTSVSVELLGLPAQVIVNSSTGAIILTADVEISPGTLTIEGLTITRTTPEPVGDAMNPLVERRGWTEIGTNIRPRDRAKLADLLAAMEQLAIPRQQQIQVIHMLHKNGQLHARLVDES